MVEITDCLHPISVDLLYRLDILRSGWLCGAVGVGIPCNLPWADIGHGRVVVDLTQARADWAHSANYVDSRFDFFALWEIDLIDVEVIPFGAGASDTCDEQWGRRETGGADGLITAVGQHENSKVGADFRAAGELEEGAAQC